ncbi:MAG: hypothetical protein P1U63_04840 [Coxiellaceae bacterium]|nr:hypothetical protein [Coxiellaceae bacterium]
MNNDKHTKLTWQAPQLKNLESRCRTFGGSLADLNESGSFVTGDCVGGPVNK